MALLTDAKIQALKAREKTYLVSDGGGLNITVQPGGTKSWVFRYRDHNGKERRFGLGRYPSIDLNFARELAAGYQRMRQQGLDPAQERRQQKARLIAETSNTFGKLAERWFKRYSRLNKWSAGHKQRVQGILDNHVLPWLKDRPLVEIRRSEIAKVLERIVDQGLQDTPHRARAIIASIFDYAEDVTDFPSEKNFMRGRNVGGLVAYKSTSQPAILEPEKVAELLKKIKAYRGNFLTRTALQLLPYLFQRPGEVRKMEWEELDLDDALWTIPAEKMKMRRLHKVPLPTQAVELLRELQPLTGPTGPVFPNMSRAKNVKNKYMSDSTLNKALRSLGYDTRRDMTSHGFRAMAQTLTQDELGIPKSWSDFHLAHMPSGVLGDTYDKATQLPQRRTMVQLYADYLDHLVDPSKPRPQRIDGIDNVIPIHRKVA